MAGAQRATILITGTLTEPQWEQIRAALPGQDVRRFARQAEFEAAIDEADAIVCSELSPEAFRRARRLKLIQSWAAGPDRLMLPEIVASPIVVTSCKGNGAIPLAEHAMMLMLMLNRDARRWARAQAEHRWDHWNHPELNGLTCGIIGLGHSGQDLALKCKAFHMHVLGMRQSDTPTPNVDEQYPGPGAPRFQERLHEFLGRSDFVVVTAPLTPETRGMLGEAEFRAMKRSAYYICFSRGGIADEAALLRALREGWIAGGGLDAHATEPLPGDSPFWDLPNAIVTPHNGASTPGTRQRGVDIAIANLRAFVNGSAYHNVVDKARGY